MAKTPHAWLCGLILALICGTPAWSQERHTTKALRPAGAQFQQSLGQLLFSPEGYLYVAYRLSEQDKTSSTLRIFKIDPVRGKALASADYAVPKVRLPRGSSHFMLSEDSTVLAYAELHAPQVLLTMDAKTLRPLSTSRATLFASRDLGAHIKDFNGQSLVLSAEQCRPRRPIIVEAVREVALNPANLNQVLFDRKRPLADDTLDLKHWMKMSGEDLSVVLPLERGALGFTNLKTHGWVRRFDSAGATVDSLEIRDCGVAMAALTLDRRFAIAVCERTARDDFSPAINFSRKAMVLEVNTLRVVDSFSVSAMKLVEHDPEGEEPWTASPSPVIWRGNDGLLVAIPDSSSTIKLYSLPLPAEKAHVKTKINQHHEN